MGDFEGGADIRQRAVLIVQGDNIGRVLDNEAEALLAIAQPVLQSLALGNVYDRREHPGFAVMVDEIDRKQGIQQHPLSGTEHNIDLAKAALLLQGRGQARAIGRADHAQLGAGTADHLRAAVTDHGRKGSVDLAEEPIGQAGEGSIAEVRVGSPLALLGSAPFAIGRIHVSGARLPSRQLVAMPFFRSESAKPAGLTVGKVMIEHSEVMLTEGVGLQDVFGELSFRPDARLEKASIESADRSLLIEAQPSPLGIALNIEGRAWQPLGPAASFASLQAKGVLQADKLLVQNIDTTFLGGILRGNWLLDWSNGLAMAGDASLSRIDARKLGAAFVPRLKLEGEVSGTFRMRSGSRDWVGLWRDAEAVLNAEVTRGVLYGVDLGEAARRNGVSEVRAGATKFDRLRATVDITPKQVVSKDLRMESGMVTASGQFTAGHEGQVEAGMVVTLQTSVSSTRVPVRIFGTLPDLTAIGRK